MQDAAANLTGSIVSVNSTSSKATVKWTNGFTADYRVGLDSKYDLAFAQAEEQKEVLVRRPVIGTRVRRGQDWKWY